LKYSAACERSMDPGGPMKGEEGSRLARVATVVSGVESRFQVPFEEFELDVSVG
jgi:hypothetical protein